MLAILGLVKSVKAILAIDQLVLFGIIELCEDLMNALACDAILIGDLGPRQAGFAHERDFINFAFPRALVVCCQYGSRHLIVLHKIASNQGNPVDDGKNRNDSDH